MQEMLETGVQSKTTDDRARVVSVEKRSPS